MGNWWKLPERALSVLALAVSVVSLLVSFLQTQRASVTGVMPVLAFVYDRDGQWILQNLGNGPALNVVVADKATETKEWSNPVRLPPLPRDGQFALRVRPNVRWLGASYMDIEGHEYSATCVNDDSRVWPGRVLPRWPEEEVQPHWGR